MEVGIYSGMKICFLEGDMSRSGGTERMTAWLANKLCKTHQVSILSLRQAKGQVFFRLDAAVSYQVLPTFSGKLGILQQIRWIHRYIKDHNIDHVINVDTGIGFYGILAAKGTGAKTVTWEHGNFYNNWGSRMFPHFRRYAARRSHAMVVLTQRDKQNYETNISRCVPVHVIPNPAQMGQNTFDPASRTILSVGHLLENKGYHRAVEMAAKVLPGHPDWQWIICGEGPERPRLEAMIKEAGLENQMKLPGLITDMAAVYEKAAMLVMTSDMEGLPMVLLEGKAHGLPLLSFDIMTGPADIIDDGINGYLVKPFDSDAMAQKLNELIENNTLRQQMSDHAAIGMEKFAEDTILNAWERVLAL